MQTYIKPELFFALASSLYVFKTLRIGPIGPEIFFFTLLLFFYHNYIFNRYYDKKILWYSIVVYFLAIISSLTGSFIYYITGNSIGEKNFFDLFAVTYSFALCIIYGSNKRFLNSLDVTANTMYFIMLINALLLPINYNQQGGFQGFSGNANQIASFTVYTCIFCFLANPKLSFLKASVLLFLGILIGIFARSDASLFFFIILFPIAILLERTPVKMVGAYRVLVFVLLASLSLLLVIVFYKAEIEILAAAIDKIFRVRFALWGDYIDIIENTYGVGFGTGKYASPSLGIMYGNHEAHNTILDLSVSFGLLTGVTVALLIMYTLYASIRYISLSYSILFVGLVAQGLVMTLYRHPPFWLLILATLTVASKNVKPKNIQSV